MGLFFNKDSNDISKDINKQIAKFNNNLSKSDNLSSDYDALKKIANHLFSKVFNANYKFTYEDLKFDILDRILPENIRNNVEIICDKLNDLEFDREKIKKDLLNEITTKLSDLSITIATQRFPKIDLIKQVDKEIAGIKHLKPLEFNNDTKIKPKIKQDETKIENIDLGNIPDEMFAPPKFAVEDLEDNKNPSLDVKKTLPIPPKFKDFAEEIDMPKSKEIKKISLPPKKIFELIKKKNKEESKKLNKEKLIDVPIAPIFTKKSKILKKEKPEENILKPKLPKFTTQKTTTPKIEKNLTDLIKELQKNKKEINEELDIIKQEQKLLKSEQTFIGSKSEKLPAFKIFNKNLDDEIKDLESKKQTLKTREILVNDKLKNLNRLLKNIEHISKEAKSENKSLLEKKEFIKSKEKIIKSIKTQMSKKYENALKEIKVMRKDLKEKEDNFTKLQSFYSKKENRLHLEESNIMNEKRSYGKLVSKLLMSHLDIANEDLENANIRMNLLKKRDKEITQKLVSIQKSYKLLDKNKDKLRKELKEKKNYFAGVEKEYKKQDEEFEKLNKIHVKKEKKYFDFENKLIDFENSIEHARTAVNKKKAELEIKDIDLKSIAKNVDRLKFELSNNETRLHMREKQVNKRISSFDVLNNDIKKNISNEKRAISKIEKKLGIKSSTVTKKLNKLEEVETYYNESTKHLFHDNKDDVHIKEIKVTHEFPNKDIGNPYFLDILRLLNIAKNFIASNQNDKSRDTYLEIQRLFDNLNEYDREEIYGEILKVFKSRNFTSNMMTNDNIDTLISEFELSVSKGNIASSGSIYSKLQAKYLDLPKEEKSKYYDRIIMLYSKIGTSSGFA